MDEALLTRLGFAFEPSDVELIHKIVEHLQKSVGKVPQVVAIRYALRAAGEKIDRENAREVAA